MRKFFILLASFFLLANGPRQPGNAPSASEPEQTPPPVAETTTPEEAIPVFPYLSDYIILTQDYYKTKEVLYGLDLDTGEFPLFMSTPEYVFNLTYSPVERILFISDGLGHISYFSIDEPSKETTLTLPPLREENEEYIVAMDFAPDIKTLYALSTERILTVPLDAPNERRELRGIDEEIIDYSLDSICVSPKGEKYIINVLASSYIFDGDTGEKISKAWGEDPKFITSDRIIYSDGRYVKIYDFSTGETTLLTELNEFIRGISITDDRYALVWTGHSEFIGVSLGGLFVVDLQTGETYSVPVEDNSLRSTYIMVPRTQALEDFARENYLESAGEP